MSIRTLSLPDLSSSCAPEWHVKLVLRALVHAEKSVCGVPCRMMSDANETALQGWWWMYRVGTQCLVGR
jgi:hypothetical protein